MLPIEAATVQVFQKAHRDLDAQFASLMARSVGFPHKVIMIQDILQDTRDYYQKRLLVDSESPLHTWAVALMRSLPETPTLFFDGLAGDVLGNAEFIIPDPLIPGVYIS